MRRSGRPSPTLPGRYHSSGGTPGPPATVGTQGYFSPPSRARVIEAATSRASPAVAASRWAASRKKIRGACQRWSRACSKTVSVWGGSHTLEDVPPFFLGCLAAVERQAPTTRHLIKREVFSCLPMSRTPRTIAPPLEIPPPYLPGSPRAQPRRSRPPKKLSRFVESAALSDKNTRSVLIPWSR